MEGQHFKGRATFDYCDDPDRSNRLTLDEWRRVCPSVADDPPDGATFFILGETSGCPIFKCFSLCSQSAIVGFDGPMN